MFVVCAGPDVLLQKRCKLQKLVRERALVQAFTTVLLILLGSNTLTTAGVVVYVYRRSCELTSDLLK